MEAQRGTTPEEEKKAIVSGSHFPSQTGMPRQEKIKALSTEERQREVKKHQNRTVPDDRSKGDGIDRKESMIPIFR